jgi:hypothetical protein
MRQLFLLANGAVEEGFSIPVEEVSYKSINGKVGLMMIKEMDIRCHLSGDEFSPKKVEELIGITLENKIEVGETATRGRYRGTPIPYGNGELIPPSNSKDTKDFGLEWIALTMYEHLDVFRNCGAENIDLVIGVFFEGQCNFTLPPKAMKLIGDTGIELQISCYES